MLRQYFSTLHAALFYCGRPQCARLGGAGARACALSAWGSFCAGTETAHMRCALVLGASGFIGQNLVQSLLARGFTVTAVDQTLDVGGIREAFEAAGNGAGTLRAYTQLDVRAPLSEWERLGHFNVIYHLACPASPPGYQKDPLVTLDTCYLGTKHALEYAARCGARLLFASTSEIYGDPLVHPQPEDYRGNVNTLGPRAIYDEGKRVGETLCYEWRKKGVDVRVVRIFNTYGPGMHPKDGRVIPNFIMQALGNEALTVYGDGSQTRSLCYIDDLLNAFRLIIESPPSPAAFGPFNAGNAAEISMKDLAVVIKTLTGADSDIIFKPLPQDDPVRRCPDLTRISAHHGFAPEWALATGLRHTIAYFKALRDAGSSP